MSRLNLKILSNEEITPSPDTVENTINPESQNLEESGHDKN